jgi:hypothetical protein
MSINVSIGFQIPTNVVEVGDEITADQLAAITSATTPTSANPFLTLAGGTLTGSLIFDAVGLQNINKGTFDNSLGGYNGISLTCAVGYELNWQGGHLGNWYSGAYSEITIDSSVHITHIDGLTVESGMTVNGPMISDESATSGYTTTYSGSQVTMGTMYISQEESLVYGFNVQLPVSGSITFGDSTTQSSAGVSSDKSIANAFAASMWYAWDGVDYARNGVVNTMYIGGGYLSAGISDGTTFVAGFPATNATLDSGSYWYVSINGTLSDIYIYNP